MFDDVIIDPDLFLQAAELIRTGGWYAGSTGGYYLVDGRHFTVDEVDHDVPDSVVEAIQGCHCAFTAIDQVFWEMFVDDKPMMDIRENPKGAYLRFYVDSNDIKVPISTWGSNVVGSIVKDNDTAANGQVIIDKLMKAYEKAKAISA